MSTLPTHTIEDVNSTRKKFNVTISSQAVTQAFQNALQEVQKTAELRGFRKGKAPADLVRKFFEQDIRKNALNQIIDSSYSQVSKSLGTQIISRPHIEPVGNFEENQEFTYSAVVDVNPQVEVVGYKELTLKNEVPDSMIQEIVEDSLDRILKSKGKLIQIEDRGAQKGDYVTLSYKGSHNGKDLEGGTANDVTIEVGRSGFIQDLDAAIFGMKAGDHKEVTVTFPADYHHEPLRSQNAVFKISVSKIQGISKPALDDKLAKSLGVNDVEALNSNIRSGATKQIEAKRIESFRLQILEQLLSKNQFDVPESLVDMTIDQMIARQNQNTPKEGQLSRESDVVRQQFLTDAQNEVRSILIFGNIARQENIQVDQAEVQSAIIRYCTENRIDFRDLYKQTGPQIYDEFSGLVTIQKTVEHLAKLNGQTKTE